MALQSVHIRGHEQRSHPSTHIVYKIEIQASVRSWVIWRRYSEFAELHTELTKSTGAPPPEDLPPKHSFSLRRKLNEDSIIQERSAALDSYLRAIFAHKDSRWRDAYAFKDFLGIPISKGPDGRALPPTTVAQFTSASWLDEHGEIQAMIRDIRADINRRDSLADRGEVGPSGNANVQAKKKITNVLKRMDLLAKSLETLGLHGLSHGELHRRSELVARLQDDCQKLGAMVITPNRTATASSLVSGEAITDAKRELLSSQNNQPRPLPPVARVLGGHLPPPRETSATRPLDSEGLYDFQQMQMEQQDNEVTQLAAILQRQKQLGLAIGNEIENQNAMLDELDADVDKYGVKLAKAKKQFNRLG
jgi:regulator of vacuolar morphogenesis